MYDGISNYLTTRVFGVGIPLPSLWQFMWIIHNYAVDHYDTPHNDVCLYFEIIWLGFNKMYIGR